MFLAFLIIYNIVSAIVCDSGDFICTVNFNKSIGFFFCAKTEHFWHWLPISQYISWTNEEDI